MSERSETESKLKAPFTAEQVDKLNEWQSLGYVHEFTCPGHEGGGSRTLVATRRGWICCHCDYKQNWAHGMMLTAPPDPLRYFRERPLST